MNFNLGSLSSAMARMVVLGFFMSGVIAFAQSPSTFQKSCDNIRYGVDKAGTPIVQASCTML